MLSMADRETKFMVFKLWDVGEIMAAIKLILWDSKRCGVVL